MLGGFAPATPYPALEPLPVDAASCIWVIGDTHQGRDADAANNMQVVLNDLKRIERPAAIIQVGDLTESGLAAQDTAGVAWATAIGVDRIVGGNHDWRTPRTTDQAMAAYGINPGDAKNWTLDLGFVELVGVSPDGDTNADNTSIVLSADALTFLTDSLAAATKDCWIICHAPLDLSAFVATATMPMWGADPETNINTILQNPRAKAWISGHLHWSPYIVPQTIAGFDTGGGKMVANICAPAPAFCTPVSSAAGGGAMCSVWVLLVAPGSTSGTVDVWLRDCTGGYWVPWPSGGYANSIAVS